MVSKLKGKIEENPELLKEFMELVERLGRKRNEIYEVGSKTYDLCMEADELCRQLVKLSLDVVRPEYLNSLPIDD